MCVCCGCFYPLDYVSMRTTSFCSRQQGEKRERERERENERKRRMDSISLMSRKKKRLPVRCSSFTTQTNRRKRTRRRYKRTEKRLRRPRRDKLDRHLTGKQIELMPSLRKPGRKIGHWLVRLIWQRSMTACRIDAMFVSPSGQWILFSRSRI